MCRLNVFVYLKCHPNEDCITGSTLSRHFYIFVQCRPNKYCRVLNRFVRFTSARVYDNGLS